MRYVVWTGAGIAIGLVIVSMVNGHYIPGGVIALILVAVAFYEYQHGRSDYNPFDRDDDDWPRGPGATA